MKKRRNASVHRHRVDIRRGRNGRIVINIMINNRDFDSIRNSTTTGGTTIGGPTVGGRGTTTGGSTTGGPTQGGSTRSNARR
jgi:hypothetical protein